MATVAMATASFCPYTPTKRCAAPAAPYFCRGSRERTARPKWEEAEIHFIFFCGRFKLLVCNFKLATGALQTILVDFLRRELHFRPILQYPGAVTVGYSAMPKHTLGDARFRMQLLHSNWNGLA